MRAYELMIILDGDLEDDAIESNLERFVGLLTGAGATIASTDRWGKRRFAYEIDHKQDGYYVVYELTGASVDVAGVERQLRLADEVVRHKIIRLPEREALRRGLLGDAVSPVPTGKE